MEILSLVNEKRTKLIFSDDVYEELLKVGNVTSLSRQEIENIHEPSVLNKLEHTLCRIDCLICFRDYLPEELLDKYDNIRVIAETSGQLPDYSLEFYKRSIQKGKIIISCGPAFASAVAEFALGQMINLCRNITGYHIQMTESREYFGYCDQNSGDLTLYGKHIGIIGFGRISRKLISLLKPFDANIMVYDPFVGADLFEEYGAAKSDMDSLLRNSDIIVVLANPNYSSKHMIDREKLGYMKDNAVIVNVSRASLIDTDALVDWLKAGRGKAAIDVFDREPLPEDSELRHTPNLIISPHRAGGIIETYRKIGRDLVADLKSIVNGDEPRYMLKATMENARLYSSNGSSAGN